MTFSVKVLFFARLREQMGMGSVELDLSAPVTLGELKAALAQRYPQFNQLKGPVMSAINQDFAQDDQLIGANDEVAFFPPVTGG